MMQAIILAGGRGSRLRPVTDHIPKPLVPVRGVPIIEWQIRYLAKYGINDVIVCAGHLAGLLKDHMHPSRYPDLSIRFSLEDEPLGTGGALYRVRDMVNSSALVLNGDVITDIDLGRITKPECIAAIPMRTGYGSLLLNDNAVSGFQEKGELKGIFMNAGIYHLSRNAFDDLPERGDIERTLFPDYAARNILHAVRFEGVSWYSIDSYKDIDECAAGMPG